MMSSRNPCAPLARKKLLVDKIKHFLFLDKRLQSHSTNHRELNILSCWYTSRVLFSWNYLDLDFVFSWRLRLNCKGNCLLFNIIYFFKDVQWYLTPELLVWEVFQDSPYSFTYDHYLSIYSVIVKLFASRAASILSFSFGRRYGDTKAKSGQVLLLNCL